MKPGAYDYDCQNVQEIVSGITEETSDRIVCNSGPIEEDGNSMHMDYDTDSQTVQEVVSRIIEDIIDRAVCNAEQIGQDSVPLLKAYDNDDQSVQEIVSGIIEETTDRVVCNAGPNDCDVADFSQRNCDLQHVAFDRGSFESDLSECLKSDNNSAPALPGDDDILEITKISIDKLDCKPSHHPNLCSPTSVEGPLSDADSSDSNGDRVSRVSINSADSADSACDRKSRASVSSAHSADSTCDRMSRVSVGSADSLVSDSSDYEVEVSVLFILFVCFLYLE